MSDIIINIKDKTYRNHGQQHQAIGQFQMQIPRNQFVCLVGPSGCGKTSLLNIIAGLDSEFHGEITLNQQRADAHSAYVFQNPRLLPWLTVRQNIELVFDQPPAELIDVLLLDMQLDNMQQVYPERLSLGMQRRVAIIRAFATNPDLLLMDEPFVSLDAPSARQIRQSLYQLWQHKPHTVLFVSHDLREAIALADRLVFLSKAPMQIVADIKVDIDRDLRQSETAIERFREQLLQQHRLIRELL